MQINCDDCAYFEYDDEDDGDEYRVVRHQM